MKKAGLVFIFMMSVAAYSFGQASITPFKAGDRVVFAGNSITEAGFYESYIWLYYMTHFPDRRITVMNGGVGGDVAEQIYRRLDGDLLPKKPTKLFVSFGMNDSKYFEYNDKKNPMTEQKRKVIVDTSYNSYLKIQEKLKALPAIEKIIMASSPYDETVKQKGDCFVGKAKTMGEIVAFQKKAAADQHWGYVDLFHPMTEINEREQKKNPAYTSTGPDRIHPGSAGHLIMAYLILKAQGLAGRPVADVAINAKKAKVDKQQNCTVTALKTGNNQVDFDYLAAALPFPYDTVPRAWGNTQVETDALKVIPFVQQFDQETLKVDGLKAGNYQLKIDDNVIGSFSGSQLAQGINLAMQKNTPEYQQALQIMDLNSKRKEIEAKFRNYYWVQYDFLYDKGLLFDKSQVAEDTIAANLDKNGWLKAKLSDYEAVKNTGEDLQQQMDALVDKIYAINKPLKRHISLVAQP